MVCADMVDHCVENGIDKYWLAPFRLPALTHSAEGCPASSSQLLSGVTQNSRSVEACFPIDGPPGVLCSKILAPIVDQLQSECVGYSSWYNYIVLVTLAGTTTLCWLQ